MRLAHKLFESFRNYNRRRVTYLVDQLSLSNFIQMYQVQRSYNETYRQLFAMIGIKNVSGISMKEYQIDSQILCISIPGDTSSRTIIALAWMTDSPRTKKLNIRA